MFDGKKQCSRESERVSSAKMAAKAAHCPLARTTEARALLSQMMYTVHVKSVTATEARRYWSRLLDEVMEGEVVLIERKGARLLLKRAEQGEPFSAIPDYRELLRVPNVDEADQWGWEWDGSPEGLRPRRTEPEP